MLVCKQCGVELAPHMKVCPLCETPVSDGQMPKGYSVKKYYTDDDAKPKLLKQTLWQVFSVMLISGIVATLAINLSVVGRVTWSIFPVTICLIGLAYSALVALWRTNLTVQLAAGWTVSSAVLVAIRLLIDEDWPVYLVHPILTAVTVTCVLIILMFKNLRVKSLNAVAILFVAVAVVCLMIEIILSLYFNHEVQLSWSVVVAACMLPVTAAIAFMHFRTRNNSDLKKIFHT